MGIQQRFEQPAIAMRYRPETHLTGSACVQSLLRKVNGPHYSGFGRVWNESPTSIKRHLWELAGLNHVNTDSLYREDWAHLKMRARVELERVGRELAEFAEFYRLCMQDSGAGGREAC